MVVGLNFRCEKVLQISSTQITQYTAFAPNPTPLRWDRQTVQFSVNAWVGFIITYLNACMYTHKCVNSPEICRGFEQLRAA